MKKTVAILTNFTYFHPGYSLTGIVIDQIYMLLKHGHKVHLLVSENYSTEYDGKLLDVVNRFTDHSDNFRISQIVPKGDLVDYQSMINWSPEHFVLSYKTGKVLSEYFTEYDIDIAFTHDWIFTGWNLPFAGGVRHASISCPKVAWFHWVHSVPSAGRDWWKLEFYGPQHKIIFPSSTEIQGVAEQFHTNKRNVFVIPHIKDVRTYYEMCDDALSFIDSYKNILTADVVQIYPAGSDRLDAKGINHLIGIFSQIKKMGMEVFLCIANSWANKKKHRERVEPYEKLATEMGLIVGEDFVFTSTIDEKYLTGISQNFLRDIQLLSNIFIFPTKEESFGLVAPEAAFAGTLPVLNRSLQMMGELYPNLNSQFYFGSYHNDFEPVNGWDDYYKAVAYFLILEMKQNSIFTWKTFCRQKFNADYMYYAYYLPYINTLCEMCKDCESDPEKLREVQEALDLLDNMEE